jgi:hypothetical protein
MHHCGGGGDVLGVVRAVHRTVLVLQGNQQLRQRVTVALATHVVQGKGSQAYRDPSEWVVSAARDMPDAQSLSDEKTKA